MITSVMRQAATSQMTRNWGRGRRPVINVSWDDAQAYASWLSDRTGENYRLPSEAEWEYACRAGTVTRYAFGDELTTSHANFRGERTSEVGEFPTNAWGFSDMHGNVWEWVEDSWHESYEGAPQDESPWVKGNNSDRVIRGGSWINRPELLRSAIRFRDHSGLSGATT